jgi:alpha-tubulin suppressor-like RCC1 family protein
MVILVLVMLVTTPIAISVGNRIVVAVDAAMQTSAALTTDGTLYMWGTIGKFDNNFINTT